jgi:superfamily II DNA or RNA helicase
MIKSPTRKNLLANLAKRGITKGLTKLAKPNLKRLLTGKSPSPIRTPDDISKLKRDELVRLAKQRGIKVTTKNKKQNIISKLGVGAPNLKSEVYRFVNSVNENVTLSVGDVLKHLRTKSAFSSVTRDQVRQILSNRYNLQKRKLSSVPVPSGSMSLPQLLSPLTPKKNSKGNYMYASANKNFTIAELVNMMKKKRKSPTAANLLASGNSTPSPKQLSAAKKIVNAALAAPYNHRRLNILMASTPSSAELRKARAILASPKSMSAAGLLASGNSTPSPRQLSAAKKIVNAALRKRSSSNSILDVPLAKRVKLPSSSSAESVRRYRSDKKKASVPKTVKMVEKTKSSVDCIQRSKIPLRDYQKIVCDTLRKQRGVIAVHSVGTGKTLTAVTASQCFLQDNPNAKVIVVTPVSLVDNFKKEMEGYGVSSTDPRYVFYSHAKFALDIQNDKFKEKDMRGNMLIIDEIHNFKKTPILDKLGPKKLASLTAAQRKHLIRGVYYPTRGYYVRKISSAAKKVLGLTATPIVNTFEDLRFPISFVTAREFMNRKTDPPEFGNYIGGLTGDPSKEALIGLSRGVFSFYERAKSDSRFPGFDIQNVYIKMPQDYLKTYDEIEQTISQKNLDYRADSEAFFTNIRNAVNKIDNTLHSPKVIWALNKIQSTVKSGGKVLLYSVWLDSGIKMIAKHLTDLGIGHNFITGEISQTKRKEIVKDYNSGKKPVLLISKAGGEGLDLKGTSVAIMLEPVWNPATEMQVFGRAVRSGSHAGLPKSKQYVKCYLLFLVKPYERIQGAGADATMDLVAEVRPNGAREFAADQIINAYTQKKRKMIREIYKEISKHSVEKKQFSPWSANRRYKRISK